MKTLDPLTQFSLGVLPHKGLLLVVLMFGVYCSTYAQSPGEAPFPTAPTIAPGEACWYAPTHQWLTVEQLDQVTGVCYAVPTAVADMDNKKGDFNDALKQLDTVTPKCQHTVEFEELKAQAELGLGNYKIAADLYTKAIDPLYNQFASVYGSDASITRGNMGNPEHWFRYAEALWGSGQTDKAIEVFNRIVAREKANPASMNNDILASTLPVLGTDPGQVAPNMAVISAVRNVVDGVRAEGHGDPCDQSYQQALTDDPDLVITQFAMARHLDAKSLNSFPSMKPYLQKAIAIERALSDPNGNAIADRIQLFSDNRDPDVRMAKLKAMLAGGPDTLTPSMNAERTPVTVPNQ